MIGATASAPAAAQDEVATSGWEELGDVTAAGRRRERLDRLADAAHAMQFMEQYPNVTVEVEFKSFDDHMAHRPQRRRPARRAGHPLGNQGYVTDGTAGRRRAHREPRPLLRGVRLERLVQRGRQGPVPVHRGRRHLRRGPALGHRRVGRLRGRLLQRGQARGAGHRAADDLRGVRGRPGGRGRGRRAADQARQPARAGRPRTRSASPRARSGRPRTIARLGLRRRRRRLRLAREPPGGRRRSRRWVDNGWIDAPRRQRPRLRPGVAAVRRGRRRLPAAGQLADGRPLRDAMGEDVGFIAPPPGESGKVVAVAALSLPFHISSKSANPDLAAAFIDFVMNPDKGQAYYDAGRVPASAGSVGEPGDAAHRSRSPTAWDRDRRGRRARSSTRTGRATRCSTRSTGSLQELIGGRTTPEDFVATVQEDWADLPRRIASTPLRADRAPMLDRGSPAITARRAAPRRLPLRPAGASPSSRSSASSRSSRRSASRSREWRGIGEQEPVGLDNYVDVVNDPDLYTAFFRSLVLIVFYSLPAGRASACCWRRSSRACASGAWARTGCCCSCPRRSRMVVVAIAWSLDLLRRTGIVNEAPAPDRPRAS